MKTILLSAGHSTVPPLDPGAVANGFQEAGLALRLRDAIATKLRERNVPVLTDGTPLQNLPLKESLKLTKQAHIKVELHFNASANPEATGVECLAQPPFVGLAQRLCAAVALATNLRPRGQGGYKPTNAGQHHRLAFCEAGGLVLEVCFISNLNDMKAFVQNEEKIVSNIARVLYEAAGGTSHEL